MQLFRTLSCGVQVWNPTRRSLSENKIVSYEISSPVVPFRSETFKSESILQMSFMSTTDMMEIKVTETNTPKDIIYLVDGEITIIIKDKKTEKIEKIPITWREPKIIVIPVNDCDYGVLCRKALTKISIKKNYKRMIVTRSKLSF